MTATELKQQPSLYLQVSFQDDQPYLPLHTSIALFLLSYCECKSFKVFLVFPKEGGSQALKSHVPAALNVSDIHLEDLPRLVGACRLPAVLDGPGRLVRAGLAVVLRHILTTTLEADPSRKDVLALLGFKKTCLKACAEVCGRCLSYLQRITAVGVKMNETFRNNDSETSNSWPNHSSDSLKKFSV